MTRYKRDSPHCHFFPPVPFPVLTHYGSQTSAGFPPTSDEDEARLVAILLLLMPIVILIFSFLNWKLLKVYYAVGHPWARIYKEFPCNKPAAAAAEELKEVKEERV